MQLRDREAYGYHLLTQMRSTQEGLKKLRMALIGVAIWINFQVFGEWFCAWPKMVVVEIKEDKDERHNRSIK